MSGHAKALACLLTCLVVCGCEGGRGGGGAAAPEAATNANTEQAPNQNAETADEGQAPARFALSSPAFESGQPIPLVYSGDGEDISPPLIFEDPPAGTVEFALTVVDPDAPRGDFVHWLIYGIPAGATGLPEGVPTNEDLTNPPGAQQGENDFGQIGYRGPLPPADETHDYRFTLYALAATLDLAAGADIEALQDAMAEHIIDQAELIGTFSR